jgi:hypothetical protein
VRIWFRFRFGVCVDRKIGAAWHAVNLENSEIRKNQEKSFSAKNNLTACGNSALPASAGMHFKKNRVRGREKTR